MASSRSSNQSPAFKSAGKTERRAERSGKFVTPATPPRAKPARTERTETAGILDAARRLPGQLGQLDASSSLQALQMRGFSNDEIFNIVAPRRTLARRKENGSSLSLIESDRVRRLERIAEIADRVFGSREKSQRWLRKANRAMEGIRPIELLESETGARLVEEELHRIDFGLLA